MECEPFSFTEHYSSDDFKLICGETYPLEPWSNFSSGLGYFDAMNGTGEIVDHPVNSQDRAERFRYLYNKVSTKRRKTLVKQQQLWFEFECLRHHLHFVDESQSELDVRLQSLTGKQSTDKVDIESIRTIHERLRADHTRMQDQADKIMTLEDAMHRAEAKLRKDEERLADYTEVFIRQTAYAGSYESTPESSPEYYPSPSENLSSATMVDSPVLRASDDLARKGDEIGSDDFQTPSCYDEDRSVASPSEHFGFPEFQPPSPLVLGPPRLATPPYPLYTSSKRISVSSQPNATATDGDEGHA